MRRWLPLSLTTALSPSLPVLLFGWSLVEGLGAVLVIPAIAALVAANYEGRQRALAYSVIGATAGIAIALGRLIGGWVTTTFTWRYVFVGEVVMVILILLARKQMTSETRIENPPKLDLVGAALSALGLGLIVLGVLKSSTWGWLLPKGALTIAGHEIAPLGFSVVPFMILGGLALLWAFFSWEDRRERLASTPSATARSSGSGFAGLSHGIALRTRQEASMIAVAQFISLPLLIFSSLLIARALIPGWMQSFSLLNPVEWAVRAARGEALPGTDWAEMGTFLLLLVGFVGANNGVRDGELPVVPADTLRCGRDFASLDNQTHTAHARRSTVEASPHPYGIEMVRS